MCVCMYALQSSQEEIDQKNASVCVCVCVCVYVCVRVREHG